MAARIQIHLLVVELPMVAGSLIIHQVISELSQASLKNVKSTLLLVHYKLQLT
jgi:hypothetical protein